MKKLSSFINSYMDKKFTTEYLNYKQVIAIIIPVFVEMAFLTMFNVLNTAMISSSGMAAVGAVSSVDSLNLFLRQLFISIATGGSVIIAQYKGINNSRMISKAAAQAISFTTALSLIFSAVIIIFNKDILHLLFGSADPKVMELAVLYLVGSNIANPFIAINSAVNGALRGAARTKETLILTLIQNGFMLVFNLIFITLLGYGVKGLVMSVILSGIIGVTASMVYLIKIDKELNFSFKEAVRFNKSIIKKLLFLGIPFAAENLFFTGGRLIMQTFVVSMGTAAMAINAISNSLMGILQCAGNSMITASITVVGQCIGRREIEDARKYIKSFVSLASITSWIMFVLFMAAFPLLIMIYTPDPEIVPTILIIMGAVGLMQPTIWPHAFIVPSGLRAAGDATFTSVSALLSMWLVRVVTGYILGVVLGFGVMGVWAAMLIEWCSRGLIYTVRLKGDKWYSHRIIG